VARERTLVILKPDAVERGLVRQIFKRFMEAQLGLIRYREIPQVTSEQLDNHFPNTDEWIRSMGTRAVERLEKELNEDPVKRFGTRDPFEVGTIIANGCRDYYASGKLVALILEGPDAVSTVRKLIGNTLPSKAEKGTIRGDFGIPEDLDDLFRGAAQNLVHASDSVGEAEREIAAWFTT